MKIEKNIGKKRIGNLQTKNGVIKTPFFMPIATKAAVKNILPEELKELGSQVVLGNTYHLWLRPGDDLIAKMGGLHRFMNWHKPILTDSGGFQVFSLGKKAEEKYGKSGVKLTEEGVEFIDPIDGKKYFMTPEKSIDIQLNLGSDMIMALDECPPYPCSYEYAKKSLELTTRWAKRCKDYFEKKVGQRIGENINEKINRPLLFAIIQGSVYEDLRVESAKQLIEIGFDGYAIGGVAVGEPREKMAEVLKWVSPYLPGDKPRYLMGLGKPEELVNAVCSGIDMFDCVIPTREGRHGKVFVWKKNPDEIDFNLEKIDANFYVNINLKNEQFREDENPIDRFCDCYVCKNFTRGYIRHLFKTEEPLASKFGALHNLRFYHKLMERLRKQQKID